MVDVQKDQVETYNITNVTTKRKELLSTAMKRTSEWVFSQELPSDVTVTVGGTSFSLHKFPLASKCGYLRKLVSESTNASISSIQILDLPGGAEAFELAAKFCYGINFEISMQNIAMLRCAAEYLQMTEEHSVGNLIGRTEAYLNEVALKSLAGAMSILRASENFLVIAENAKLVSRCIDSIALFACRDSNSSPLRIKSGLDDSVSSTFSNSKPSVDWWAEDLTNLKINLFQRVIIAMIARGFKQHALGPILMLYAQKSLCGLDIVEKGRKKVIEPREEHEKRVVLETIVSLLPREKNTISVSFLSMLLRTATFLETTVACRHDLEKRIGLRLGQAELDDLLIPSYSLTGNTLFDVETVERIVAIFLESQLEVMRTVDNADDLITPSRSDFERVTRLVESYLAEIASDRNLSVAKFVSVAELVPEQPRITEDGMYRAVDIYMKAHPDLSDMERKKVCSVMDCQKLSREARVHAAQNERLPVQTVIQVLFQEQQRLRDDLDSHISEESSVYPAKPIQFSSDFPPLKDEVATLQRENKDLKLEMVKLKLKLQEIEKYPVNSSPVKLKLKLQEIEKSPVNSSPSVVSRAEKSRVPRNSFISSVSKRIGRFFIVDGVISPHARSSKVINKTSRDRRHSIS